MGRVITQLSLGERALSSLDSSTYREPKHADLFDLLFLLLLTAFGKIDILAISLLLQQKTPNAVHAEKPVPK